jgi:glutamate--cysteine ligase
MSAPPQSQGEIVAGKAQLVEYLEAGCKPPKAWRIGTEHEKFCYSLDDFRPLPYEGERGIRALTLEPGGQFELSGAQLESVHQTCGEVHSHLAQLREIAEPLGVGFLGIGMSPKWTRAETPVMPKGRYKIMSAYMPKVGSLGLDMMFRTCTVQVNLDFSSEADMVKKLRVASRCSRSRPPCSRIRRSPKASRTASCRTAPKSGATPTPTAPACCPGRSRTAWASSATRTTRSTCRCIS